MRGNILKGNAWVIRMAERMPICVWLYAASFVISVIPAFFYTAPAFEDGLGTMASAAYLAGYDWSGFLAVDGYYYKYGQSLWYLLPFLFIPGAVARYRVMLVINSVLASFIPVLAWRIAVEGLQIARRGALLIAFLTGLYPPILLYSKYTWAETNLLVLPWLILWLLIRIYRAEEGTRGRDSMFLAAAVVYAFMSHQRGMVLLLAVTGTLVCLQCMKKKGLCWPAYLLVLGMGLIADRVLSAWQRAYVYAGAVMEHNTLWDFLDPEVYRKLLSMEGIRVLLDTAAGWLFHSGASTFGCAFLGLFLMLRVVWRHLGGKEKYADGYLLASLFGLFSYFGAFSLGLLFFFQDLYGYFDGSKVERCDHLLFGRYLESSVPILLFLGLIVLWGQEKGGIAEKNNEYSILARFQIVVRKRIRVKTIRTNTVSGKACSLKGQDKGTEAWGLCGKALLFYVSVTIVTICRLLPQMAQVDCYVHSLMSLNLFMDTRTVTRTLDVIPNYTTALAAFAGVSFLVFACLLRVRGRKGMCIGTAALCILFLWIYIWNSVTVIGRVDACGETKYAAVYIEEGE